MKKVLYVSDLDGTLLRSNQTTSEYTNAVINRMVQQGLLFSYATARSLYTARKVTAGLYVGIPLILYNGGLIMDNRSGKIITANYFDEGVYCLLEELFAAGIYPIVYGIVDGRERFSYILEKSSNGIREFVQTRNDVRKRPVDAVEQLCRGNLFYITCIDEPERLLPFFEAYKERYHCVYQRDIYSGEQWLEIMPGEATKANAVSRLKTMYGCNYVVAFGDGMNDREMFAMADECYAVENAVWELKFIATAVIAGNDQDGVAKWLEQNCGLSKH